MAVATEVNSPTFKDIITIVIKWVAGLIGPISIPLLLGMIPLFRRSGPTAALGSWAAGLFVFWLTNYGLTGQSTQVQIAAPVATSLVLYVLLGLLRPEASADRDALLGLINDDDSPHTAAAPLPLPASGGLA